MTDVTVLCKVVDNFGDIGVVYRLARALSALDRTLRLRIVTDNRASFALLAPGIDPQKSAQEFRGWRVYDWNADAVCTAAFTAEQPRVILECFQCGRPAWLETLLFDTGVPDIVHIINLEYLTAESWADDFHCLASLTRSVRVQKVNFMPGFTARTGGLILDEPFASAARAHLAAECPRGKCGQPASPFTVLIFSYPRDFASVVSALARYRAECAALPVPRALSVCVAAGISAAPFFSAWEQAGKPFPVRQLPFMAQEEWDVMLTGESFLFVRGEDSLSRACLAGIPFVWHAYVQKDNVQLDKVRALLCRMEPFFSDSGAFSALSAYWIAYNTPGIQSADPLPVFRSYDALVPGFRAFARSLFKNGDLAAHLLSYIRELK